MNNTPLSEKEFEIVNVIGDGFRLNQRQISEHTGLSLGMTNLLVRRLVTKGYLRIRQLDRKKVDYILTVRGLSEKLRKTFHYTRKTIESFGLIRSQIRQIVESTLTADIKYLIVAGEGDLADLTSLILQEAIRGRFKMTRVKTAPPTARADTLIINAAADEKPSASSAASQIHLLGSLAQGLHKNGRGKS